VLTVGLATFEIEEPKPTGDRISWSAGIFFRVITATLLSLCPARGQNQTPDWQIQIRAYAEARDWHSAMGLIEEQIARDPGDLEARAWRARVLTWSDRLAEAESEYLEILKTSPQDPDNWMGLGSVYIREGKIQEATRAIESAEKLDPERADVHIARARVLRAGGERNEARLEFQTALKIDPQSIEARAGLISVRNEPKNELRLGQDNDLFNFSDANHLEWASLTSKWTPYWTTSISGDFYQRGGANAEKLTGSVTRRKPKWGAVTVGGAVGHDNAVIPKHEAFFDLDRGFRTSEANFMRAVEFIYGQHWYWYQASTILALNTTAIIYLPREWTLSIGTTVARSAFSGTSAEWRPSGNSRVGFPLARWGEKRIAGYVFFATGTEDFARVDQIGRFASQTYGSGLRFAVSARQDISGYGAYQKRTQNRTDTSFGLSYGIHF
jgi:tetratricopeptide (TPR) repeat protein